ncbi:hypothetical protein [Nocardiopsis suaedae]|uniref:DUF4175 domain-containing protein n=1 Tax=Nocardiopsis suaedae TaxID=3018444 RepID=A0ABT4TIN5_9ACTN|nr:hypothetical protein [Nocardiopsis suaedae]MDA2804451.1 hypothetical protein [Nocardiopsis suaedae]
MAARTRRRTRRSARATNPLLAAAVLLLFAWLVWGLLDTFTGLTPGSPAWMALFGAAVGIALWEIVFKPFARAVAKELR